MSSSFTKNRSYTKESKRNDDLPYETVRRIAEMRVINKSTPAHISRTLNVPYSAVVSIINTRSQHSDWIDAIADMARKDLINE